MSDNTQTLREKVAFRIARTAMLAEATAMTGDHSGMPDGWDRLMEQTADEVIAAVRQWDREHAPALGVGSPVVPDSPEYRLALARRQAVSEARAAVRVALDALAGEEGQG